MLPTEELQTRADGFTWYHSINLGEGVTSKGSKSSQIPLDRFPDFSGRSVLDIGAWDGYYSFLAERQGASRVVALDHYVWGLDWDARARYWSECQASGTLPDHSKDATEFWLPDLPGRRAFEFAKETLQSEVEPIVGDFATMDIGPLGIFDVVLYLGVLYHMKEPLTCLERLRQVTKHVAVIETATIEVPGFEHENIVQFSAADELNRDYGNWYMPNVRAIHALCQAAGFSSTTTISSTPTISGPEVVTLLERSPAVQIGRAVVHAYV